jgi:hypothetical protein
MLATLPRQLAGAEANWFAPGRARPRRSQRRRREGRHAARVPAPQRAGRGHALRRLPRGADEGQGDARGVREHPPRRGVSHELHAKAARARLAATPRLRLWTARLHRLWKVYLRFAAAFASVMGAVILTVQYFVVLPVFAWAAKRVGEARAPRGSGARRMHRRRGTRTLGNAVLMKILGISAHFHDSAPPWSSTGCPSRPSRKSASRAQERRGVPVARHRVVPRARPASSRRARRRRLLREADAQVRAHPHDGAPRVPAEFSSFPHAMKNTLGEKLWVKGIIKSYLGIPATRSSSPSTTSRTPPPRSSRSRREKRRSSRPTASASGRRSRSVGGKRTTARRRSSSCASSASRTRSGCSTRRSRRSSASR